MPAPPTYKPDRTGDDAIDRNLDGISSAVSGLNAQIAALKAQLPSTPRTTIVNRSFRIVNQTYVSCEDIFAATTIVLPDAVSNTGKQYQVRHTSDHSGTPVVTVLAQKLRGRQQLIAGSVTQTVTLGSTLSVRSDGENWLVV